MGLEEFEAYIWALAQAFHQRGFEACQPSDASDRWVFGLKMEECRGSPIHRPRDGRERHALEARKSLDEVLGIALGWEYDACEVELDDGSEDRHQLVAKILLHRAVNFCPVHMS